MRIEKPRAKRGGKVGVILTPGEARQLYHLADRTQDAASAQFIGRRGFEDVEDGVERFRRKLAGALAEIVEL